MTYDTDGLFALMRPACTSTNGDHLVPGNPVSGDSIGDTICF